MSVTAWLACGLGAFDVLILVAFYFMQKLRPPLDRRGRLVTAGALSGFVFHAFLFFEGPILYVHLAMLAVIYFWILMPLKSVDTKERGVLNPSDVVG